jgi:hypothetical protein
MSLAKELLQKVHEAKQAEDEMSIPTYDDLKTPNNHVANSSNATKERKVTGLGDRVEKKPTADIGTPHNEKGRKMSEAHDAIQALNMSNDGHLLTFSHPGAANQVYSIEWTKDIQKFLQNTLRRTQDVSQVFDLLHMYYEEGEGQHPHDHVGLNASIGEGAEYIGFVGRDGLNNWKAKAKENGWEIWTHHNGRDNPLEHSYWAQKNVPGATTREEAASGEVMGQFENGAGHFSRDVVHEAANPIVQALNMHGDGRNIRATSPDGTVGMIFPTSPAIQKAINGYISSPDARQNTQAAAERLFTMLGNKVPGVQSAEPEAVQGAGGSQSYSQAAGGDIDTSGMSLTPMESKGHKTADGEMKKPTIKAGVPAKTAKVRGKQNDEPKNKGNAGTGKEEKGQEKKQFTVSPKDYKGGENEHKSMKKMHENIKQLESLLGRRLDKVREAYGDLDGYPS